MFSADEAAQCGSASFEDLIFHQTVLVLMYILMNVGWVLGMFAQQGFSLDQNEVGMVPL